jgi:putative transposase
MCRVLGVSTSGYYAWRNHDVCERAKQDGVLRQKIRAIHRRSDQTYGAPRIHEALRGSERIRVGRKRVARLMVVEGIHGVTRRRRVFTTRREAGARPAADLLARDFTASGPDQKWVADITFVSTGQRFLYLAVVLDVWSRRVVGWAMDVHLRSELVLDALEMALRQRCPKAVIHHSDQGTQYTSMAFALRCKRAGVRVSMGSTGDAYDNALCESFFATLKCERLKRRTYRTRAEARRSVFEYIEGWYNCHRLHSKLGYVALAAFERR